MSTPILPETGEVAQALGLDYRQVFYIERNAKKKLRRILIRRLGCEFFGVNGGPK